MTRPNFLMAEPEPPEAISARKLVLETAKFNVITAYSGSEALELLHRFPALSACIFHSDVRDIPCETLVRRAKDANPNMQVIVLSTNSGRRCDAADHHVPSQWPEQLLQLLREEFGDPRGSAS
jgi:DNA-binding NtrC family response regulator